MARRPGALLLVLAAAWLCLAPQDWAFAVAAPAKTQKAEKAVKAEKAEKAEKAVKAVKAAKAPKAEKAVKAVKAVKVVRSPDQPKRPLSAYMLWLEDNRASLVEAAGTNSIGALGKAAGEAWGKLTDKAKAPYEKKAAAAKEAYSKALEAFKAKGGVVVNRVKKDKKEKKQRDPNAPKRPLSGYMFFMQENRAKIVKRMPEGYKITEVAVEAGKEWTALSDAKKAPYLQMAQKAKAAYDAATAK